MLESYIKSYLPNNASQILSKLYWNDWMFEPGMPKHGNSEFINKEIRDALFLANYYIDHKEGPANKTIYANFIVDLRIIFVQQLSDRQKDLTADALRAIDKDYLITIKETNPEVESIWYKMIVYKKMPELTESVKKFLSKYGRMKYILPIYSAYAATDKTTGMNIYKELKSKYHPIAQRLIEQIFSENSIKKH